MTLQENLPASTGPTVPEEISSIVATRYGSFDVLERVTESVPVLGPDEYLVKAVAIGVNPVDYKRYGGFFGTDAADLPLRLGSEAAGVVVAAGSSDAAHQPGAEVVVYPTSEILESKISNPHGTYSDYIVCSGWMITPKPASVDWQEAAVVMAVGCTAWDLLSNLPSVSDGGTLVVLGASGGVGSMVAQIAKSRGIRVIGTASDDNVPYLESIGVEPISRAADVVSAVRAVAPDGVGAIVDTTGDTSLVRQSLDLVADSDRVVTCAAMECVAADGVRWVGHGNPRTMDVRNNARVPALDLLAAGTVRPRISQAMSLWRAGEAHRILDEGLSGKTVLMP